jgi:hypothetical protein
MCCDTSKEAAMKPVFQEILTVAMAKLEEGLAQETGETQRREWDPDAWEQEVRQFTRQLGQQCRRPGLR